MRKYQTRQGDMWDSIAYRLYGDERYMVDLLRENQKYRHIYIFPSNIELNVPSIDTSEMLPVPPWMSESDSDEG